MAVIKEARIIGQIQNKKTNQRKLENQSQGQKSYIQQIKLK
jgi:hypothetical protein